MSEDRTELNPISIRKATAKDVSRIAALCDQLGYPTDNEEVLERLQGILGRNDHAIFVAQHADGEVIGWVHVYLCPSIVVGPCAELGGLIVEDRYRQKNIGRLLMTQVEQWSREKGCQLQHVRTNILRKGAHAFYERIGYRIWKTSLAFRKEL